MARRTRSNPYAYQDKYLIAEQPGLVVLVSGLLIAIFIGLIFRALISPTRIRPLIERAASNVHKEMQIKFDNAEVSITDGFFPRLAVVVSGIRMDSKQECWMSPALDIDQIRLPISFISLLRGHGGIQEVQADNVRLTLRSDYKNCLSENVKPEVSAKPAKSNVAHSKDSAMNSATPAKRISMQQSESASAQNYSNLINSIKIDNFQISHQLYPSYRAEFYDISLLVKKFSPREFVLNAKTHLLKDEQVGDYLAHANIHLEFSDAVEPITQLHVFGNWREGHYSLVSQYNFNDHNLNLETEIKHIPLSQIINILNKYQLIDQRLNARKLWLSLRSKYNGPAEKITSSSNEFTNLQLDGDEIEMDIDKIVFKSFNPIKFDPIVLNINKLNLDSALNIYNRRINTPIFAHLGVFKGKAEVVSSENVRLFGNYSGLEFIFSNKGQRELQSIANMRAEAQLTRNQWSVQFSKIEPTAGVFSGDIKFNANSNFSEAEVKIRADEVALNPAVQKLMTQNGDLGILGAHIDVKSKDGKLIDFKGSLKSNRMLIEGVEMIGSKIDFSMVDQSLALGVQVANMNISKNSAAMQIASPVLNPMMVSDKVSLSQMRGKMKTKEFKQLQWQSFVAQSGAHKIEVNGGWDFDGSLFGKVQLKAKKENFVWDVSGTRSEPKFIETTGPKK